MWETRDLGIKCHRERHTIIFCRKGELGIGLLKDVKNLNVKQARKIYWHESAAKHEYEDFEMRVLGSSFTSRVAKENH